MKGGGIMLAIGTPKDKPKGGSEREYAREAFSAVKDGDEEGFIEAFLSAVRECKGKKYEEEETEDED